MGRHRERKVTFRLTEDEYEHLEAMVNHAGLSKEEYVRRRCISGKGIIVQDKEAILKLIAEVRKVGSNINQIARVANGTKDISHDEVMKMLAWEKEIYIALASVKLPSK